jgi:penicillin-binding protein 1A
MLEGVVQFGTARAALSLKLPLGGKTGTTNDFTDAWFMGFSPSITSGVWIGFDEKKSLGAKESGARAALPVWIDFMKEASAGKDPGQFAPPPDLSGTPPPKVDTPDTAPAEDEVH